MPVLLVPVCDNHANQLVEILNSDEPLRQSLGTEGETNRKDFLKKIEGWKQQNHGETYAIVLGRQVIGTLSISEAATSEKTVKIGYWIGSPYWNNGYGTIALRRALEIAKKEGAHYATATIPQNSIASYRMWKNAGASITETAYTFHATISLIEV